jgi:hypothetical protein
MRRLLTILLLFGTLLLSVVGSAQAANADQASCLGVTASSVDPGTKDDVALTITAIAEANGTTHGQLVQGFAHQTGACVILPPIPPHP